MQNRSAIWMFTILLVFACLYQLSFTWVDNNVNEDAVAWANEKVDSIKGVEELDESTSQTYYQKYVDEYLVKVSGEEVFPIFGFNYRYVSKQKINKGLDLQGGMNVTLEVSLVDLVKALSGNNQDETFQKAIKNAINSKKNSTDDFVTLFEREFNELDPNGKLASIFHNMDTKEKVSMDATNEQVIEFIRAEAFAAIKRTEQVIRRRIDNLGVVQPKVQRLEGSQRILIELPGVKNKERVRKILQGTAKLEFWETYENSDIYPILAQINDKLKSEKNARKLREQKSDSTGVLEGDTVNSANSPGKNNDSLKTEESELAKALQEQSLDATTTEKDSANIQQQDLADENPLFSILNPSLEKDENTERWFPGSGPVVGYCFIMDTGKVRAFIERQDFRALFPGKVKFLWDAKPIGDNNDVVKLFAIKITRTGESPLDGEAVTDARVASDPMGRPEVSLIMNRTGAIEWRNITGANIGKSVAIVLDNYVYSAPTVQSEISGGISSISGRFTVEEAEDLSNVLKAGKLPAPANIIEEAVVGPTLGKENVRSGMISFAVALFIILLYMWFYYAKAGIVADIALVANMFFIMGVLSSIGATLTLPGIAGIVLTIGMSVDANVLIYERIREELTAGKGLKLAITDGYKNAYSSILDANITTLLTGIILLAFGSGVIKGFATTLIIGIMTSLFSAIFITRLIFEWRLDKKDNITFATRFTEGAFKKIQIKFIARRRVFYIVSGIIITVGVVSIMQRGLNYGVDFTGGRSYLVKFEKSVGVEKIAEHLSNHFVDDKGLKQRPEVKTFGGENQVNITTKFMIEDFENRDADVQVEQVLNNGLSEMGLKYELMRSQKVGPTIADDIKVDAVWSIAFSLIVIFLYIVLRFRKWQFGLGALIAMAHDVLIVLSVFSLLYGVLPFSMEIDQAFIAAILTVVGYSINDTVVVFDRIREYLGLYKRKDPKEVVNSALNSTLSRTINTSLSTFFVLLMIFLFGGESIQGFVFALMIGVVVGTYSSLCIATPIVVDVGKKEKTVK